MGSIRQQKREQRVKDDTSARVSNINERKEVLKQTAFGQLPAAFTSTGLEGHSYEPTHETFMLLRVWRG